MCALDAYADLSTYPISRRRPAGAVYRSTQAAETPRTQSNSPPPSVWSPSAAEIFSVRVNSSSVRVNGGVSWRSDSLARAAPVSGLRGIPTVSPYRSARTRYFSDPTAFSTCTGVPGYVRNASYTPALRPIAMGSLLEARNCCTVRRIISAALNTFGHGRLGLVQRRKMLTAATSRTCAALRNSRLINPSAPPKAGDAAHQVSTVPTGGVIRQPLAGEVVGLAQSGDRDRPVRRGDQRSRACCRACLPSWPCCSCWSCSPPS